MRALGRNLELVDGRPRAGVVKAYDEMLVRIGYRLDADDCFTIAWRPDGDDAISRAANWLARVQPTNEPLSVVSCALRAGASDRTRAERERLASSLFDGIQKACPRIFHGQTAVTEPYGPGWVRNYGNLDARLETNGDRVVLIRYRAGAYVDLGRVVDWEKGVIAPTCAEAGVQ